MINLIRFNNVIKQVKKKEDIKQYNLVNLSRNDNIIYPDLLLECFKLSFEFFKKQIKQNKIKKYI